MRNRIVLLKIDHIQLAMPVGEEESALRFYSDALGMTEVPKPENLAKRGGCWFQTGDVRVHLGVQIDFKPATKAHPAFEVDDFDALCERLDAAGFQCNDDEPLIGFRRTNVSDPFGNRLELMARTD
ncbi:MAG: VOC family protein [Sneathiella sp.]|uniref:VOC family protein n=1 Tax=Sneathiella sp. TaxID=1964365 RepID=UPI003001494E